MKKFVLAAAILAAAPIYAIPDSAGGAFKKAGSHTLRAAKYLVCDAGHAAAALCYGTILAVQKLSTVCGISAEQHGQMQENARTAMTGHLYNAKENEGTTHRVGVLPDTGKAVYHVACGAGDLALAAGYGLKNVCGYMWSKLQQRARANDVAHNDSDTQDLDAVTLGRSVDGFVNLEVRRA